METRGSHHPAMQSRPARAFRLAMAIVVGVVIALAVGFGLLFTIREIVT